MRLTRLFGGIAVTALCAVSLSSPAYAQPEGVGFSCGFSSTDDPTGLIANPGTQVGEIDGGPVVGYDTDDPTYNPVEVYIGCSIQVNGTGIYTDPDAVFVWSEGDVVGYLPPTPITYTASATDNVYECTTWWIADPWGHTTIYLDDTSGEFVSDPSLAHCALAVSASTPSAPTGFSSPRRRV